MRKRTAAINSTRRRTTIQRTFVFRSEVIDLTQDAVLVLLHLLGDPRDLTRAVHEPAPHVAYDQRDGADDRAVGEPDAVHPWPPVRRDPLVDRMDIDAVVREQSERAK